MQIIKYGDYYVRAHGNGQYSATDRAGASRFIDQVATNVLNHIIDIWVKHTYLVENV